MARKEAGKGKAKMATMREVLDRAKELERFSSEPDIEGFLSDSAGTEGQELRKGIEFLIEAIVHLPRAAKTLRDRLTRAEAENVRAACEVCELLRDQNDNSDRRSLQIAVVKLDAALVRLAVMAA